MSPCYPNADGTCQAHGGHWVPGVGCRTIAVLKEVRQHRAEQFARYGTNNDLADGTGPGVHWLRPIVGEFSQAIEASFRQEYLEWEQRTGAPTWMHLVREELAEAFMEEPGSPRLREELLQVAALCVSWIETMDERNPRRRWQDYTEREFQRVLSVDLDTKCVQCEHTKAEHYAASPRCMICECPGLYVS